MRPRPAAPALLAALASVGLLCGMLLAPAQAASPTRSTAPAAAAAPVSASGGARVASHVRGFIVFDRNWRHQFDSRIRWRAVRVWDDGRRRVVDRASWRAGSGLPDASGTRECVRDHGWAPKGRYTAAQYDDYWGSIIQGRVFYLGNKVCQHGVQRTDLFIHSEQGAGNTQCADRRGDQACRWEWPRINDYKSNGCIKMAPRDLAELVTHYQRWFRAGVRYPLSRMTVRVRN